MSKVISRYLFLLREVHQFIVTNAAISKYKLDKNNKVKLREIEKEYNKLARECGAIISGYNTDRERTEDVHFLFDDPDFCASAIKHLIRQGEKMLRMY